MKTLTKFFLGLSALALPLLATAGVNPTTAWFNGESFESDTVLTDLTASGTSPFSGWTKNAGYVLIQSGTTFNYSANASSKFLGFTINKTASLAEVGTSGSRYFYKTFPNSLDGLVYGKMAFYTSTGGSTYSPYQGTDYQLKDASGNIVFEFGGMAATSNALFMSGVPATTMNLGARAKWADIEFVLDIPNKKMVKASMSYNGTTKTYTNISLAFDNAITQLYVYGNRGYVAGAIDNATLGQLVADAIVNLQGEDIIQSLSNENVSKIFSANLVSTVMDTTLTVADLTSDINWTISDWGSLSSVDQALVTLTRSAEDTKTAALTVGSISADATITVQAQFGTSILTKQVLLKSVSIEGLKATLTSKTDDGKSLLTAVTDENPYISSEKGKLNTVISNSEALVASASSTIEDVTLGLSSQETANIAFSAAMAPYNAFVGKIATVQATHDAEVRSAAFFAAIKTILQSAIDVAVAAKATVADTAAIAAAQTAVLAAETQFKADVPAYAALETQISATNSRLAVVNPRVGDYFLNYDATAATSLRNANSTADGLLLSATTATELSTGKTTLADALTAFNAVPRKPSLTDKRYKIYSYGNDGGDGDTIKKVLTVVESMDTLGIDTLNYAPIDNELAINTEWSIETKGAGTYIFKNIGTETYLNGTTLSSTQSEFTLPENTSQAGLINQINDQYFFYSIVNSSNKALEIDLFNVNTKFGKFVNNSSTAPRMRFSFQFEEQAPPTSTVNTNVKQLKAFALDHSLVVAGLELNQDLVIYNVAGKLVKSIKANSEIMQFNLPAGVYVVKSAEQVMKAVVK